MTTPSYTEPTPRCNVPGYRVEIEYDLSTERYQGVILDHLGGRIYVTPPYRNRGAARADACLWLTTSP